MPDTWASRTLHCRRMGDTLIKFLFEGRLHYCAGAAQLLLFPIHPLVAMLIVCATAGMYLRAGADTRRTRRNLPPTDAVAGISPTTGRIRSGDLVRWSFGRPVISPFAPMEITYPAARSARSPLPLLVAFSRTRY